MKKHSFRPMWRLIKRRKYHFGGALIATVMTALIGFITPAVLAELIDHYLGTQPSRMPAVVNNWLAPLGGRDNILNEL
ncbi:MAG: hypothetical protein GX810_02200 [Clostridiales bacterium]|nr:hypothetical protein [Clostridiales bacterium]